MENKVAGNGNLRTKEIKRNPNNITYELEIALTGQSKLN